MSREVLRVYRWMWRELRRRRGGAVVPTIGAFIGVAGVDLVRCSWLGLVRAGTVLSRDAAALPGRRIAAGIWRGMAAGGFCILLFGPLAVALLASQQVGSPVPHQGEIRLVGAGAVLLDGDRMGPEALEAALSSRGLRTLRVTVDAGTPVSALAELRGVLGASGIDRIHVLTARELGEVGR